MQQYSDQENPWQTLSKKSVYENNWIHVEEHQVINPAGKNGIYGVVHFKNYAIGILPIDFIGNIWLVGQFRYPFNKYSWEIPEGGGYKNDNPIIHAKRELLEEVGLTAKKWTLIQEMQISNSVSDEVAFIYLAEELEELSPDPDENEQLNIKKIHIKDAMQLLENGEIKDSLTIVALLKAQVLFAHFF